MRKGLFILITLLFSCCGSASASADFVGTYYNSSDYVVEDTGAITLDYMIGVNTSWSITNLGAPTGIYYRVKTSPSVSSVSRKYTLGTNETHTEINDFLTSIYSFSIDTDEATDTFSYWVSVKKDESVSAVSETKSDNFINISITHIPLYNYTYGEYTYTIQNVSGNYGGVTGDVDGLPAIFLLDGGTVTVNTNTSVYAADEHTINMSVLYNQPPALLSPTDTQTFTVGTAPYTEYVTFLWSGNATKYNIQIATDPSFQSILKNLETTGETISYYLYKDEYYWRVRSYDSVNLAYSDWSETYEFTISITPPATIGNNIYGVVYESTESGYNELENAIVTISNDTYYDSLVTASTGYYFFNGLANSSTYYIVVTKDGYVNSQVVPVTTGVNESINKDILLQKIEGEGQYYENHYVRFIVTDKDLSQTYDANLKIYVGESTTAKYDKNVGVDGAASFLLDQQERYRIETTYNGQTQTDYITPSETSYYIFLEFISTGDTFLPTAQFYDDVNITVTKNDDTGVVTVYYNDSLLETNSLKFQIGQTLNNGTFILIEESAEFIDTDVKTFSFAALTNYVGEDYQVRVLIDHDSFGALTKKYGVSFPGSNLPFGRGIAYLCVFVLMIAGMQFSEKDANSGAILICGLASLMWYMDIFEVFGSGINTLMGIGLGMAVLYAILKYINDKRMAEGL